METKRNNKGPHSLVICEKPSLARTVFAALNGGAAGTKRDGYLEGSGYLVSWCFGHLYELDDPEAYYDEHYKKGDTVRWTMNHLPFYPENWEFKYSMKKEKGIGKQVAILRELMNRGDVGTIYAAGDADREGEVIVRLVLEQNLKQPKIVLRLWLPSLTPEAIRKGVSEAKADDDYESLYEAGKTRAQADWLLGIELTRYCTLKAHSFYRIGRCICPIVSKIVEREKEIRDFRPEKYLAVESEMPCKDTVFMLTSKLRHPVNEREQAEKLSREYNAAGGKVTDTKIKRTVVEPGRLFSMSDLQSFLCRKDRSLTPSDVLSAVQELYEKGYVTYPRTASNYLCKDESGRVDGILEAFRKCGISGITNKIGKKSIYDDSKVESHSALTPTDKLPEHLTDTVNEAYDAIRDRFLSVFAAEECVVNKTELRILVKDEEFTINGSVVLQRGWMNFEDPEKKDRIIPRLEIGAPVPVRFHVAEKETKPPKRYTVESLNAWMKAPFKETEKEDEDGNTKAGYSDEEWKDILSEATVCTEATRADTIDRCIKSGYIELQNGTYRALANGFEMDALLKTLGIDLSLKKTVELSRDIHGVAAGGKKPAEVLSSVKEMLDAVIKRGPEGKSHMDQAAGPAVGVCPRCGSKVYSSEKGYGCSSGSCDFFLWKDSRFLSGMKKQLTDPMAEALLKNGKVYVPDFYSVKKDTYFGAYLLLHDDGEKSSYSLSFERRR